MQDGLLFHSLHDPRTGLYFSQVTCRIDGPLNVDAFQRAWQNIVDRHPAQRTSFVWKDVEDPLQVVWREARLPVHQHDHRHLPPASQDQEFEALVEEDRRRGFDLTSAPLHRLHLVRCTDRQHRLLWSNHHLVMDGWSLGVVLKEVFDGYSAYCRGEPFAPPPVRPYRDYIAWLETVAPDAAADFWTRELSSFEATTDLGGRRRASMASGEHFGEIQTRWDESTSRAVEAAARTLRITPSVLVHGAWAILLKRLSGDRRVLFGTTVSGRPADLPEVESMVGLFINSLPVGVDFPASQPASDWLRTLQERLAEMRKHEASSLVEIQSCSPIPRGQPLFESLLVVENYPLDEVWLDPEQELSIHDIRDREHTNFPLTGIAIPGERWAFRLLFDADRFDRPLVETWMDAWTETLAALGQNTDLRVHELTGAAPRQDLRKISSESHDFAVPAIPLRGLAGLFEDWVDHQPSGMALEFQGKQWSYGEVESLANGVAAQVLEQELSGEPHIAVCFSNPVFQAIATLGVWKAGRTAVPVESAHPANRRRQLLESSRVSLLLTDESLADSFDFSGTAVCPRFDPSATARPSVPWDPRQIAYVIHTSGSTGTPKGVEVPQAGACATLRSLGEALAIRPTDRVAGLASCAFDVSILEMFLAWGRGACWCLSTAQQRRPGIELEEFLGLAEISVVAAIPSLLESLDPGAVLSLRALLLGGEPMSAALARKWNGHAVLYNCYGPTEASIQASLHPCDGSESEVPPLGGALPGMEMLALDEFLQPIGPGEMGELFLSGVGLAQGYANRPAQTAEVFLPHPRSSEPGRRMYRTGDRVFRRVDGSLVFRGRMDQQVKVRGHRIELGEIEHALQQHPGVMEATVLPHRDDSSVHLVAYVAASHLSPEQLRESLAVRLPTPLLPARIHVLAALPKTSNGKVDRRSLAELAAPDVISLERAPSTSVEKIVAGIWSRLLGHPIEDAGANFFEQGGHSLLATRVVSRVQESCSVSITTRALFENPRLEDFARIVAERRQQSQGALVRSATLPVAHARSEAPLSFSQSRLWFLQQYAPQSAAYNIPGALRLRGPLNRAALERAFRILLERHQALRTQVVRRGNEPVQQVATGNVFRLIEKNLDRKPSDPDSVESRVRHLARQEATQPFNLSTDPLLRVTLWTLGEQDHVLLITLHHIIADGWSLGLLLAELSALYNGADPNALSPLPFQYSDFALWQRQSLEGKLREALLSFWRSQLEGIPRTLDLPFDFPRPPVQTDRGAICQAELDPSQAKELLHFARQNDATPFMAMLAVFQVLLSRYSGQRRFLIGTPVAGRSRSEWEDLVGLFVNTVAVPVDMTEEPTFDDLIERVRSATLDAFDHQDLPFELLVEDLQPERDLSHPPLFQVMFTSLRSELGALNLNDLEVEAWDLDTETSQFDLTLHAVEHGEGVSLSLEYNTALFREDTARRLLENYRGLLTAALRSPDQPVSRLPMLAAAEEQRILRDLSGVSDTLRPRTNVVDQFEEVARQHPDRVALSDSQSTWTYRQLDGRANQLADQLQTRGVAIEQTVGLFLERSCDAVIAMLGIFKASAAYVPLDPTLPARRVQDMMEDADVGWIITNRQLRDQIPSDSPRVVLIDELSTSGDRSAAPARVDLGECLAYVMFTSGSTGRPKGVAVPHHALRRLFEDQDYVRFGDDEIVLQTAPLSFDPSAYEIWGALGCGGTLHLSPPGPASLHELSRSILEKQVTTLYLTTGVFHQMVEAHPEAFSQLRQVVTSGDVLSASHVKQCLRANPQCAVVNGYGPTEVTVYTHCHRMVCLDDVDPSVSIGRVLPHTTAYILDDHLLPVPLGVPGTLYAGGDGLARGYSQRPELTAERFVPDPFSTQPGARLYNTGDRARLLADGRVEFLGRLDHQVKVRGFRIELAEVESCLEACPGVQRCAVVAAPDRSGTKRLVAYVVGAGLDSGAIRSFVASRLPDYMVPSLFEFLDALPLTDQGKIDRRALPVPQAPSSANQLVAPRSPAEEVMAGLFADLLEVSPVGVHDGFFERGGHSLLATQLVSRIREIWKVELPLREVFEKPTVAGLVPLLESLRTQQQPPPPLVREERGDTAPLSFAQQRLWFLMQWEPASTAYHLPIATRLEGALNPDQWREAWNEIVARHDALRTRIREVDGEPVARVDRAFEVPLEVVDLSSLPDSARESEAQARWEECARKPFDLEQGPLLRGVLLRLGHTKHFFGLTLHHIAADGWSLDLLFAELGELLQARQEHRPPRLEPLPVRYSDFAAWQRRWLGEGTVHRQLDYWKRQLRDPGPPLTLPADFPRSSENQGKAAVVTSRVPAPLLAEVKSLGAQEQGSLFMTLLAGFQCLLHRWCDHDDIVVGTPVAGRRARETESLIGFFVNTLVMRTQFSPSLTFRQCLDRVRQTALEGYAHQDVPFEQVLEELSLPRIPGLTPLFQVMFVVQNTRLEGWQLPGLSLQPVATENQTAKYDLTVSMEEDREGLEISLEYRSDRFHRDSMNRLLACYVTLLRSAVARPDALVRELALRPVPLDLRSESARGPEVSIPNEATIHSRFQEQVRHTPHGTALVFDGGEMDYFQLEQRANQWAHLLRKQGVRLEDRVGVCLDRSPEAVVLVLAVLKASAAYVPLDPKAPKARLAHLVKRIKPRLVVTRTGFRDRLPESCPVLEWEDQVSAVEQSPHSSPPHSDATGESLAYLLFTSGSTGEPKQVAVPHRAVLRLVWQSTFARFEKETFAWNAPLSFDASTLEIFGPLLHRSRLAVFPDGALSLEELGSCIRRFRVTTLWLTAGLFHRIVDRDPQLLAPLNQLLAGGDVLSRGAVLRLLHEVPDCKFVNGYGPTECTTFTCCHPVSTAQDLTASVPIGRPISNTAVHVLDESLQPVPKGFPGRLFVTGDGLARGYEGDPAATAARFLPNPFAETPGSRMYDTGDMVRELPGGAFEFLGRHDQQVKIRGFRVEPGEVERHLAQHPDVQRVVVVAREDLPGGKGLVAYWTGTSLAPSSLRDFLLSRVPGFLVPSAFVWLQELPLNANGKVERRSLPAPDESAVSTEPFVPPRNETERALAAIWEELLQRSPVGANDDFFELGGHSLLATRLVSKIRTEWSVSLPLQSLFEQSRLRDLAAQLPPATTPSTGIPTLAPRERPISIPPSFAQERLWFLDQWTPDSAFYNVPLANRLRGPLNHTALGAALQELVQRHEALRTSFPAVQGKPVQHIHQDWRALPAVIDLTEIPEDLRESQAQEQCQQEARKPFDLANGPLFRAVLWKLADDDHLLSLVLHHIVADAWSMGVLVEELARAYRSRVRAEPSPLSSLPVQFADYSLWQAEWLTEERRASHLDFWKTKLRGFPRALDLPTDFPRPRILTTRGATEPLEWSERLTNSLRELGRRHRASLFMTLLAGFDVLLARFAGHDQVLVGSPVSSRTDGSTESMIGFFLNTLVLPADISRNPSFEDHLREVRRTVLDGFEHQDFPFEELVEELEPKRDLSRSPLFQAMLVLQNRTGAHFELEGISAEQVPVDTGTSRFDLAVIFDETDAGLVGIVEYSTDLFRRSTIRRIMECFERLLDAVCQNPQSPVKQIPLVQAELQPSLVDAWSAADRSPPGSFLPELLERARFTSPDAIAVELGTQSLTYRKLHELADVWAKDLVSRGVKADACVAICLPRSLDLMAATLGVWKAGGAVVPIDPSYPPGRIQRMVTLANCSLAVTTRESQEPFRDLPVTCLLAPQRAGIDRGKSNSSARAVHPRQLAYVVFTSGSTGEPKGVAMDHGALANMVLGQIARPGFSKPATVLQFAPSSFDVYYQELLSTWSTGGKLVLVEEPSRVDPDRLWQTILDHSIERMFLPCVALHQLANHVPADLSCCRLRTITVAGEQLKATPELAAMFRRLDECRLENQYGPSESHLTTAGLLPSDSGTWSALPSIGNATRGVRLYVLDSFLQLCPIGVAGQLYVAGSGVARGYIHRSRETASRFLPDPFASRPGERMYRTGDRVRREADESLTFLGRADGQVKIRGYRIEPSEVESALTRHPAIRQATVVPVENERGVRQLLAYLVLKQPSLAASELRHFLRETLPDYMIPSSFRVLDSFPLTSSGKVDRRSLNPSSGALLGRTRAKQPATPGARALCQVLGEVLACESVDLEDNFFEIGGHSLLATQVVSRIREQWRVDLPLKELFQAETIGVLAEFLDQQLSDQPLDDQESVGVDPAVVPVSFGQRRLWFLDRLAPGPLYNMPLAIRLEGALDRPALERSLTEIMKRHESLRTAFPANQGQPLHVVATPTKVVIEEQALDGRPVDDPEFRRALQNEATRPFDIEVGPLVRARLFRLSAQDHVLVISIHHIVCDGWSLGILFRELRELYGAYREGRESPLTPLSKTYADHAKWQQNRGSQTRQAKELEYWKEQLRHLPSELSLPLDRPRPPVQTFPGDSRTLTLDAAATTALESLVQEEQATLFMGLLAGWGGLLSRLSGQQDFAIGTPVAGRTTPWSEGLIGFFVNTLVLRLRTEESPSFRELLQRVKETTLEALSHQQVPFEQVVETVRPARDLSRSPLFQVLFALQNAPMPDVRLSELSLTPLELESPVAKFDLSLSFVHQEGKLHGTLEFNTDLFDGQTVERMLNYLGTFLRLALRNPDDCVFEIPLEEAADVDSFRGLVGSPPQGTPCVIVDSIGRWARDCPHAPAIQAPEATLSYGQLDRTSSSVAEQLRALGIGLEDRVAVCAERSAELVVALLGIWKAGAAYVPLDPAHPSAHRQKVLRQSGAQVLLSGWEEDSNHDFPSGVVVRRLPSLRDSEEIHQPSELRCPTTPANLAYVIFTSGSTGVPKGVEITHSSLHNLVDWHCRAYDLKPGDRTSLFAGVGFDALVWEIWPALASGACLSIPDQESRTDPQQLRSWLTEQAISVCFLPTPLAELVLPGPWPKESKLRVLLTGGDRLHGPPPEDLPFSLVNHYGPTEDTVVTTVTVIPAEDVTPPPIGEPIQGKEVLLLDGQLRQVPRGAVGEICIAGEGLARGYAGKPRESAERFVPHPFSRNGERLYRTGDLGRVRNDGRLEFLGRKDAQIKVRGVRIEPAEIEQAILGHPEVEAAAVVLHKYASGARLAAYAVSRSSGLDAPELQRFLAEKLPAVMVPDAVVLLDRLPVTANGKIDHRALPEPSNQAPQREIIAPRSKVEERIAAVWKSELGLDTVSVFDNFFEIGGHSLLLVRVHDRLQQELAREFSILELFAKPTIAALAETWQEKSDAAAAGATTGRSRGEARRAAQRSSRRGRR